MNIDILTILTLVPLFTGITLIILPQILPKEMSSNLKKITRNICMGIALAMFAIATMIFIGTIGNVEWTNLLHGEYVLKNEQFSLISSIGVQWKVGADAL